MNYRRGLQRLYVVLVICWIAFVVIATQSGRWRPWPYMPPAQSAQSSGPWEIESETPIVPPASESTPSPTKSNVPKFVSPEKFLRNAAIQEERHRSMVRWSWVIGLAIVPSALGYLLFYVAPWVYRGFRWEAQNRK